ncbi:hypothetical protein ACFWNK_20135 [Streptomyces sp. NPDC058417]
MRRTTVQKPLNLKKRTESRRLREEADRQRPAARPEVREDIARTWWPEG